MVASSEPPVSPKGAIVATTHKFRKVIYSSLFGLGLTAGGVTLASAATNQQKPPTTVETPDAAAKPEGVDVGAKSDDQHDADEVPNYTSSVTVPVTPDAPEGAEGSEADEAKADKAELAKLEKVAKIDAKAAPKAATDKVPGTAAKPELDEEHGNVVYEVDVTAKDGTVTEVIVDAGNGRVLAQQAD